MVGATLVSAHYVFSYPYQLGLSHVTWSMLPLGGQPMGCVISISSGCHTTCPRRWKAQIRGGDHWRRRAGFDREREMEIEIEVENWPRRLVGSREDFSGLERREVQIA